MITPVILSGGSGTRLWPLSTPAHPKQFHALAGERTMFGETLARAEDRARFAAPIIVCGPGHVDHVRVDLARAGVTDATIIAEPVARNTAPAIALAAHAAGGGDAVLLIMSSDHVIADLPAFDAGIDRALADVQAGALATFGIAPDGPHTGYGYIAAGAETAPGSGVHRVDRFVEKPDVATAEAMLAVGGHYWNAGIFLMRADAYLRALATHAPDIAAAAEQAMTDVTRDGDSLHPAADAFASAPSDSIDYAVMEHAAEVVTVPVSPGWSDLGSWTALHELAAKDAAGNAANHPAQSVDSSGNLLHATNGIRITTLGVHDLIIIATGAEVLVLPRDRAQEIKRLAGN